MTMSVETTWEASSGFMIMAANLSQKLWLGVLGSDLKGQRDRGQSVVEFLLMLPMLIGLTAILVKLNTAIQISIVDQQYARAQALYLAYNSPYYPDLNKQQRLIQLSSNQLIVGVSDNSSGNDGGTYIPKATVQSIARSRRIVASDAPKEEPAQRANVRIRNTVTICTQTLVVPGKDGTVPILAMAPGQGGFIVPNGTSTLGESSHFSNICGSSMQYEQ